MPSIAPALLSELSKLFPKIFNSLVTPLHHTALRCVLILCETIPTIALNHVVLNLLPCLSNNNRKTRLLASESLLAILSQEKSQKFIFPFLSFILPPLLSHSSDPDVEVRKAVSRSFSLVLPLLPLESAAGTPEGMAAVLQRRRASAQLRLLPLLDGNKIKKFEVPIKINVCFLMFF